MQSVHVFVSIVVVLLASSAAALAADPVCSIKVPPMPNFNASRFFTGRWYAIGATPHPLIGSKCAYGDITPAASGPLALTAVEKIFFKTNTIHAHVTPAADGSATASAHSDSGNGNAAITIVDTDYNNWAILVACVNKIVVIQHATVLSRTQSVPSNSVELVQRIAQLGFNTDFVHWGTISNQSC